MSYKNYDKLKGLFEDLINNGIKYPVYFSYVFECETTLIKHNSKEDFEKDFWFEIHKMAMDYGYRYPPFYRLSYMTCGSSKVNDFNIAPNGDIYKCLSGIGKSEFFLDNINNYGTENYYRKLSQFVEYKNMKQRCYDCKFEIICGGWCRYKKMIYGDYCPYNELENVDMKILKYSNVFSNNIGG